MEKTKEIRPEGDEKSILFFKPDLDFQVHLTNWFGGDVFKEAWAMDTDDPNAIAFYVEVKYQNLVVHSDLYVLTDVV